MQQFDSLGRPSSHKGTLKLAAVSMAVLALVGCGGGDPIAGVSQNNGDIQTAASNTTIHDVDAVKEFAVTKKAPQAGDWPEERNTVMSEKEMDRMESVELSAMGSANSASTVEKSVDEALNLSKGFDAVAEYSVGVLSGDVGPGGSKIIQRSKTVSKSLSLINDADKAGFQLPDVLYVRAGSIDAGNLLNASLFQQVINQKKAILIEREQAGRKEYEKLLWNVFGFKPEGGNAIMVRAEEGGSGNWEIFLVEDSDYAEDSAQNALSEQDKSIAPSEYSLHLDSIASIVKGQELLMKAAQDEVVGIEPVDLTKAKSKIYGDYVIGQVQWRAPWLPAETAHVINPKTWAWTVRADICSNSTVCGAYGSSTYSHNVWGADLANIKWWDDWVYCGEPGAVDPDTKCGTGYKKTVVKTKGSTDSLGVEYGVSLTVEGEAGVPFIAKSKVSSTVSTKASYNRTWRNETSTTYEVSYNILISGGKATRFGRGDWSAKVSKWLHGRHERRIPLWTQSAWCDDVAPRSYGGADNRTLFAKIRCESKWNPDFKQRLSVSTMKTFGVKKWVSCMQNNYACLSKYRSGNMEKLEAAFPL